MSEGYSGSDLRVVCREAAMTSLRKVFKILEDHSGEQLRIKWLSFSYFGLIQCKRLSKKI